MKNLVSKSIQACLILTAFNFCLFSYSEAINNTANSRVETQDIQLATEFFKSLGLDTNTYAEDYDLNTPLHDAIKAVDLENIRVLIDNGADVNVINNQGWIPTRLAFEKKSPEIVQILEEAKTEKKLFENVLFELKKAQVRVYNLFE